MINSIFVHLNCLDLPNLWTTVTTYFWVFGLFFLTVWILCTKNSNEKESIYFLPFCLSMIVGLTLLIVLGLTLLTVKGLILTSILLYASLSDWKTRSVSNYVAIMIFILSLVGFVAANLPSMLIGAALVFIPQFTLAIVQPNRACGGADLKISTALAFLLGAQRGVFALIVGMLLAIVFMTIYNRINAKDSKEAFPLVPFLSVGAMLAYIV